MTAEKTAVALGWRVYGLGVMAVGLASLVFREFDPGQPVPDDFPARTVLACAAGALMVVAAAAIEWRRTVAWGAAALAVYYTLFVVVLMNGRVLLTDYAVYVTYENIAMQLAIAVGALIIFASTATIDAALAARLTRAGATGVWSLCADIWRSAFCVYEYDGADGAEMAAAFAGFLGLCDWSVLRRGGVGDFERRAGAAGGDSADRDAGVLRFAGELADFAGRSREPL